MIAFCYTVFDGLEFLEASIENHRPFVDAVIVCYQRISNNGLTNEKLEQTLADLRGCVLVEYKTDLTLSTKENERRKHNLMIETARQLGCTHFILSATDHFYEPDDMKKIPALLKYDVTFTGMFTYYKFSDWQLTPVENYFMPFVTKLSPNTCISNIVKNYPVLVDPSVRVNTFRNSKLITDIMLHHYSFVRENITEKLNNSASRFKPQFIREYIDEYTNYNLSENKGIKYFQGRKVKVVLVLSGLEKWKHTAQA